MSGLPALRLMSVKVPVSDIASSRRWYAELFGLREVMEWPDADGVVRGVGLSGLGDQLLALREHFDAATATKDVGFLNVVVPSENHLPRARPTSTISGSTTPLSSSEPSGGWSASMT